MVGRVITLYLRAGIGVANLALRTAARGAELAVGAVRIVTPASGRPEQSASEDKVGRPADSAPEPPRDMAEPSVDVAEPPREVMIEPQQGIDYDSEAPGPIDELSEKAKTIDDEPELVAEFAEPGAEDGASAELAVDEPWEGYDDLMADEVVERIGESDAAALAVIELYEQSNKQRRTVLAAVERRQRELANAPS